LAYHLGWPQRVADVIEKQLGNLKRTQKFKKNLRLVDSKGRDSRGRFTKKYNRRRDVRRNKFASISEKQSRKNWGSMSILKCKRSTILRKNLALLSLPIVTMNGTVRNIDGALGQSLKDLCGFDYKQSTVAKHMAELKYLGLSTHLLYESTQFWRDLWGKDLANSITGPLVCYYIDGNTKPLWSSFRVKKNKVTMLGKVMGCIEHVFIHDGLGHPVYFETYSGHAPVGEHILGLFEKIDNVLSDVPGLGGRVRRAIVMDGANNSVRTLRSFATQEKYHYITTLDDNQTTARNVIAAGEPLRYRYGKATLKELSIELLDSKEKFLIRVRGVRVSWDNGRTTTLITSLPPKLVDSSELTQSYFKRWPCQEIQFKNKKAAVSLNRVVGYGKKEITNPLVLEKQQRAKERIDELTKKLFTPLKQIGAHEKIIAEIIPQERKIKAKSKIVNGVRVLSKSLDKKLKVHGKQIRSHQAAIKKIEGIYTKDLKSLRKHQKEWLRLQGKEQEYEADVELDQILTFYRVSLANLYAYFVKNCLGESSISMLTILSKIIHLQAEIKEADGIRKITLQVNKKDPKMMEKLAGAINIINALNIIGPKGLRMKFDFSS
jgi:hypothetical protein